jgi:hypothetical protein
MPDDELQQLSGRDWELLTSRIAAEKCTPIIGPGAYSKMFPINLTIARDWTVSYPDYPFEGLYELGRVAQYLSVVAPDPMAAKDDMILRLKNLEPPDYGAPDEPHSILASLPLPLYLTTSYDNFMYQALKKRREKDKDPVREFCHWNEYLQENYPSVIFEEKKPTVSNPVVYHLHGYNDLSDSLVLTDDDYLDFLVNVAQDNSYIPERIQRALSGTSLLLLGYQLEDWNFRVLFRSLAIFLQKGLKRTHIAVQFEPEPDRKATQEKKAMAQRYFERYFGIRDVKVYWGTCQQFVSELKKRWDAEERKRGGD